MSSVSMDLHEIEKNIVDGNTNEALKTVRSMQGKAYIVWQVDDIKGIDPTISDEDAQAIIDRLEDKPDMMIETGWEVLEVLVNDYKRKSKNESITITYFDNTDPATRQVIESRTGDFPVGTFNEAKNGEYVKELEMSFPRQAESGSFILEDTGEVHDFTI